MSPTTKELHEALRESRDYVVNTLKLSEASDYDAITAQGEMLQTRLIELCHRLAQNDVMYQLEQEHQTLCMKAPVMHSPYDVYFTHPTKPHIRVKAVYKFADGYATFDQIALRQGVVPVYVVYVADFDGVMIHRLDCDTLTEALTEKDKLQAQP